MESLKYCTSVTHIMYNASYYVSNRQVFSISLGKQHSECVYSYTCTCTCIGVIKRKQPGQSIQKVLEENVKSMQMAGTVANAFSKYAMQHDIHCVRNIVNPVSACICAFSSLRLSRYNATFTWQVHLGAVKWALRTCTCTCVQCSSQLNAIHALGV